MARSLRRLGSVTAAASVVATLAYAATAARAREFSPIDAPPSSAGWKQTKIGLYENRLRAHSHPFKIFQYFASVAENGRNYMTSEDIARVLFPYRDVGSTFSNDHRHRKLLSASASHLLKLADVDAGDGKLSFHEFTLLFSLLTLPTNYADIAFSALDQDGTGTLSKSEFLRLLDAAPASGGGLLARMGMHEQQHIMSQHAHGLIRLFFGTSGEGSISRAEFTGFLKHLHAAVRRLEFYSMPVDPCSNTISLRDWVGAALAYADPIELEGLCAKIRALTPDLAQSRVSLDTMTDFDQGVVHELDRVDMALEFASPLGRPRHDSKGRVLISLPELERAILAVSPSPIPSAMLSALAHVFSVNKGNESVLVDWTRLAHILRRRQQRGMDPHRSLGASYCLEVALAQET